MTRSVASLLYALTFLLLIGLAPAHAQSGRIEGVVLDASSNEPLAGVNLSIVGTVLGASSGINGRYFVPDVPDGSYTVRATMIGYHDQELTTEVTNGSAERLNFRLDGRWIEIPEIVVERVTLTGGMKGIADLPGSAHFISPTELERFDYGDVTRVLRHVPGVNVQEEDGYGLRPNVGLRGSGSERSSKITVMEDGVPVAPAPYAAPAAYYFPTVGRMQAVEVRKGSSQIKYGPYTTGGALNFISTQIPDHLAGRFDALAGEDNSRLVRAHIGNSTEHLGFLLETYQQSSDGFKNLDGGGSTGFDKRDYLAKLRFSSASNERLFQSVTLKLGRMEETSDETYLGLTDADFSVTPSRRYAASQRDRMDADHTQIMVRHVIRPVSRVDLTTTLYRNEFSRNWYKLDAVRSGADSDAVGISRVLSNPEQFREEIEILGGATSPLADALAVKANNRSYYARGVQSVVGFDVPVVRGRHDIEAGIRVHEDEMDRFQWVDQYRMVDGVMVPTVEGVPGTDSNRLERARATSVFLQYRVEYGPLTAIPGLRYEHVSLRRLDFGREDPGRTGSDLSSRTNTVDAWIPGVGVNVEIDSGVHAFAGVHRGFAPPDSREDTRPESSVNYEVGGRLLRGLLSAEAVVFFTNYTNLLGSDLAASGGQGTTDQFNGGAVDVYGVELSAAYDVGVLSLRGFSVPLRASYTLTSARFANSFESDFEPWGTVEEGDDLPYVPRHQISGSIGLETIRYRVDLSAQYTGRMRTRAGHGTFLRDASTDRHLTLDLSAGYRLGRRVEIVGRVLNLTDATYVAARRPAGIRPGLPRRLAIGVKTTL